MVEETENIVESEDSVGLYTESVNSTIQGYRGAKDKLASLAQEPTQNAKDNPMKEDGVPHIIFELIEKDKFHMLTITDENTKGLDGKRMKFNEVIDLVKAKKSELVSNFTAITVKKDLQQKRINEDMKYIDVKKITTISIKLLPHKRQK